MATRAQACVPGVRKERGMKFGRAPRASCAPEILFHLPFEHLQRRLSASLDWVRDRRGALSSCFSWLWGSRAYTPTIFVGKHETARGLLLLEGLYFEGISFSGLAKNREMISSLLGNRWYRSTTVITRDKVGYTYRAAGKNTVALLNSFCPLV